MIHFVRDLAQLVTHRAQTVDALTARLGTVLPEGDSPAVLIAPSDPRLRQVRIARLPDGSPFTIGLTFAHAMPLGELTAAFGPYKTLERSDPDMPWPVIFPDIVRGKIADVSLTVQVEGPLGQLDQRDVAGVTLRIDQH
jgi:hypothetical protein